MRAIEHLSDIAGGYDALFCDAWGVIHDGRTMFPGAAEAMVRFRQEQGPVVILTNAPRLSDVIPRQLDRLGLPREAYDAVVTSGDATKAEVEARKDTPFFRLGPPKDDGLFDAIRADFVSLDEAEAILCTGPMDDERETPEDYRGMLEGAASRRLPMICANPDKVVRYGDRLLYCAGALGDLYETLGGEVILAGKPHPPIYRLAFEAAALAAGRPVTRPLAIGDGVHTDVLGANHQDVDVVFVAHGVSLDETRVGGRLDTARAAALLEREGVHAEYVAEGLAW
jgi:HAD superfamily hydrolase (TIGR01459 family)